MSWLFGDAFLLSHRVAVYLDGIGIVHDTITDGVGQHPLYGKTAMKRF